MSGKATVQWRCIDRSSAFSRTAAPVDNVPQGRSTFNKSTARPGAVKCPGLRDVGRRENLDGFLGSVELFRGFNRTSDK